MSPENWLSHIEAWPLSGLSKAEYAKQHQLSYSQFLYWLRKHEANNASKANQANPSSDLIPVKLPEPQLAKSAWINSDQATLGVLEYPNGIKLHIHHPDLLKSLPDMSA